LDLGLDIVDRIRSLDVKGDRFARQRLDEDLHATTQAQYQVERGLLLDIVIRERTAILQLLACKDKTLLVWWNTFLILDLGLDIVDRIRSLDVKGDGLARQGFHEDLHATAQAQYQVERGLLLDVVIRERTAIL